MLLYIIYKRKMLKFKKERRKKKNQKNNLRICNLNSTIKLNGKKTNKIYFFILYEATSTRGEKKGGRLSFG